MYPQGIVICSLCREDVSREEMKHMDGVGYHHFKCILYGIHYAPTHFVETEDYANARKQGYALAPRDRR